MGWSMCGISWSLRCTLINWTEHALTSFLPWSSERRSLNASTEARGPSSLATVEGSQQWDWVALDSNHKSHNKQWPGLSCTGIPDFWTEFFLLGLCACLTKCLFNMFYLHVALTILAVILTKNWDSACLSDSLWYNCIGWLGIKHQVTYIHTALVT